MLYGEAFIGARSVKWEGSVSFDPFDLLMYLRLRGLLYETIADTLGWRRLSAGSTHCYGKVSIPSQC